MTASWKGFHSFPVLNEFRVGAASKLEAGNSCLWGHKEAAAAYGKYMLEECLGASIWEKEWLTCQMDDFVTTALLPSTLVVPLLAEVHTAYGEISGYWWFDCCKPNLDLDVEGPLWL